VETILRSAERHDRALSSDEMTPQERLQRLADAFDTEPDWAEHLVMEAVAADQDRPARAPATAKSEKVRKNGHGRFRGVGLFLAIVVGTAGAAGAIWQVASPALHSQDVSSGPSAATRPLQSPAEIGPLPNAPAPQPAATTAHDDPANHQSDRSGPSPLVPATSSSPASVVDSPPRVPPRLSLISPRGQRPTYVTGETLVLAVEPREDAYVYCFYQDANGTVARIFPNRFQPNPFLHGGKRIEIPSADQQSFLIRFDPPGGRETISCVAADRDVWSRLPDNLKAADLEPLVVGGLDEVAARFREVADVQVGEVRLLVNVIR
jgi:hypothetical protein